MFNTLTVQTLATSSASAADHAAHLWRPGEFNQLWSQLNQPTALAELAVLFGCLGVSWLLVRLWRGRQVDPSSVWFGRKVFDGVLFPLLALILAVGVRRVLQDEMPLAVFRIAVPVLVSLAAIRLTVKVLGAAFPASQTVRVVERTVSWVAWLGMVLWVTGVLPLLIDEMDRLTWKLGGSRISLLSLVQGVLSAIVVLILSLSLSAAIESRLLKGATENLSLRKIASNAIRAVLLACGLLVALSAAGIDLTAFSVLGGAIGVGLGFGLQKLAANYVSGFVILAERSLRIGDLVRVDNFEGRITDINTRYTVLRAANGRESIVPNELLITQRVENASLADPDLMLSTVVQVGYGTDLTTLMPDIVAMVSAVPRVLDTPRPQVFLTAFAADGLELTVNFWVGDPQNGQMNLRSEVNLALLSLFNRLGVEIPFPQRVVHAAPAA